MDFTRVVLDSFTSAVVARAAHREKMLRSGSEMLAPLKGERVPKESYLPLFVLFEELLVPMWSFDDWHFGPLTDEGIIRTVRIPQGYGAKYEYEIENPAIPMPSLKIYATAAKYALDNNALFVPYLISITNRRNTSISRICRQLGVSYKTFITDVLKFCVYLYDNIPQDDARDNVIWKLPDEIRDGVLKSLIHPRPYGEC